MLYGKELIELTSFASREEERYALNGICFDPEGAVAVACDGKHFLVVPVVHDDESDFPEIPGLVEKASEPEPFVIDANTVKNAAKQIPKCAALPFLERVRIVPTASENGSHPVTLATVHPRNGSQKIDTHMMEGAYPMWQQCVPREDRREIRVQLNAAFLADFLAFAKKHGDDRSTIEFGVPLPPDDMQTYDVRLKAVRVRIPMDDGREATGVIMPIGGQKNY